MEFSRFLASGFCIAVIAYFFGGIPFGYIIGKFNGLDIRRHGSKNIGATNVRRVLGKDWGLVCFFFDFMKGYLTVTVIGGGLGARWAAGTEWGEIFAVLGAVLGHVYPFLLHFKGGKGVATSLGAVMGVGFFPVLCGGMVWYLVFLRTRIVSVASMAAGFALPLTAFIMYLLHWGRVTVPSMTLMLALAVLIVFRHKENIARLRQGKELRFK